MLTAFRNDDRLVLACTGSGTSPWLLGETSDDIKSSPLILRNVWTIVQHTELRSTGPGQFGVLQTPPLLVGLMARPEAVAEMTVRPLAAYIPEDQDRWRALVEETLRQTAEMRTGLTLPKKGALQLIPTPD